MAEQDFQALINDPDFKALPPAEQSSIRREFYEQKISQDPDFKSLAPEEQENIRLEVVGADEEKKGVRNTLKGIVEAAVTPIEPIVKAKEGANQAATTLLSSAQPEIFKTEQPESMVEQVAQAARSSIIPIPTPGLAAGAIELQGPGDTPLGIGLGALFDFALPMMAKGGAKAPGAPNPKLPAEKAREMAGKSQRQVLDEELSRVRDFQAKNKEALARQRRADVTNPKKFAPGTEPGNERVASSITGDPAYYASELEKAKGQIENLRGTAAKQIEERSKRLSELDNKIKTAEAERAQVIKFESEKIAQKYEAEASRLKKLQTPGRPGQPSIDRRIQDNLEMARDIRARGLLNQSPGDERPLLKELKKYDERSRSLVAERDKVAKSGESLRIQGQVFELEKKIEKLNKQLRDSIRPPRRAAPNAATRAADDAQNALIDDTARPAVPSTADLDPLKRQLLDSVDSKEAADAAIKTLAAAVKPRWAAQKGGEQSWAATAEMASKTPTTAEKMAAIQPGTTAPAHIIKSQSDFMDMAVRDVISAAKQVKEGVVPRDAFLEKYHKATLTLPKGLAVESEAARALNAIKMQGNKIKALKQVMNSLGGEEITDSIIDKMSKIDPENPATAIKFIRETQKSTFSEQAAEGYSSFLFSGPGSQIKNLIGNAYSILSRLGERTASAAVDLRRGAGRDRFFGEVGADVAGLAAGVPGGVTNGLRAFRDELLDASAEFGDIRGAARQAIKGPIGKAIRVPLRVLSGVDAFFETVAKSGETYALAYREAQKRGVPLSMLPKFTEEFIKKMDPATLKAIAREGQYRTFKLPFNRDNFFDDMASKLNEFRGKWPLVRLLIPTLRAPYNLMKFSLERSPLQAINVAGKMTKGMRGGQLSDELGKLGVGSLIAYSIWPSIENGTISGSGPTDEAGRAMMATAGRQPYAINHGGKSYGYQGLEPLATQIGLMADIYEYRNLVEEEDAITKIVGSIAQNMGSKFYLENVTKVLDFLADPQRNEGFLRGFAGTVVPRAIAQVAQANDTNLRRASTIGESIQRGIPGQREKLFVVRDIWGKPLMARDPQQGAVSSILSPLYIKTLAQDRATLEIVRLRGLGLLNIGSPRKSVQDIELTDSEYDQYSEMAGQLTKNIVDQYVNEPGWDDVPDFNKAELISEAFNGRRGGRAIARASIESVLNKSIQGRIKKRTGQ